MSPLLSFGLGMASIGIVVFGTRVVIGHSDVVRDGRSGAHRIEISVDRLERIPTPELTFLAEQFHVLTVHMYEELCTRRSAERSIAGIAVMPHEQNSGGTA